MAYIMIRRGDNGALSFYLPKKDLEDDIVSLEFETPQRWGGELVLKDGSRWHFEPLEGEPRLPITVRARRVGGEDD